MSLCDKKIILGNIMNKLEFDQAFKNLTPKQEQVLKGILSGETDEAIAESMGIGEASVRKHVQRICEVFDLKNTSGHRLSQRPMLISLFSRYEPGLVSHKAANNYPGIIPSVVQFSPDVAFSDSVPYVPLVNIEAHCYREISKTGALIRIKASKGMGKTSLMNRILEHAKTQGYKTVTWNFLGVNQEVLQNLDKLLKSLCNNVNRKLDLNQSIADVWDEFASSNENCSYYLKKQVLPECNTPLVLALDNVDRIFLYQEVATDFLLLLRSWHEEGKNNSLWGKLRLIIVHSTESYIPIDINYSPFNVGLPIELTEFTPEQVQTLSQEYGLNWNTAQISQLMDMVGGHPYLINTALNYCQMHSGIRVEEFLKIAPTQASPYNNYLVEILDALQSNPQLMVDMRRLAEAKQPLKIEASSVFKLDSLGLINKQGNEIETRNKLFNIYFRDRFASEVHSDKMSAKQANES